MKYERTLQESDEPSQELTIEDFAAPSELRGAHNFASSTQQIESLAVHSEPPSLGLDRQAERQAVAAELAATQTDKPGPIAETDFLLEARLAEADPPFRTPSSWQQRQPAVRADRHWNWSERSTAAFLGFAAGILIIVPLVFFISMTSHQVTPASPPASAPLPRKETKTLATTVVPVKTVAVASVSAGNWFDTSKPVKVARATQPGGTRGAALDPSDAEHRARRALDAGRTAEARAALRTAASPDSPQLWFMLAETYDPLAGKGPGAAPGDAGTSETLRRADIKFARYYYQQALTHGFETARDRLAALPKP
ncbi:MAG: hypothetical protein ACR2PI_20535 [Hyphomicrobiaceae bacterium]